jgi:hypothetical protein
MPYGSLLADVVKSSTSSPITFQNTSGTEIGTLCRAWVNFNGTGTVAIRASFNVTSITDNGTGQYTVNFTTAMPDANYAPVVSMNGRGASRQLCMVDTFTNATGNVSFTVYGTPNGGAVGMGYDDVAQINVSIFR